MKYAMIIALVFVGACASGSSTPSNKGEDGSSNVTNVKSPEDAIDKELMLALSQAKNLHHKAKVFSSDGNIEAAIVAVRQILTVRFPAGAPEGDDVRNDARALLAKLLMGKGQLEEAMRVVQEGIAQSQRESFFVANLYTVQGEIHEEMAKQLGGDPAANPKVKEELHAAVESFDHSLKIDEALQKKLVESK